MGFIHHIKRLLSSSELPVTTIIMADGDHCGVDLGVSVASTGNATISVLDAPIASLVASDGSGIPLVILHQDGEYLLEQSEGAADVMYPTLLPIDANWTLDGLDNASTRRLPDSVFQASDV
jgi:hypothetical protein